MTLPEVWDRMTTEQREKFLQAFRHYVPTMPTPTAVRELIAELKQ